MDLTVSLAAFFRDPAPVEPGDGVVVAFSGGPDSTALLLALSRLRAPLRISLAAAHWDHGQDADSPRRARAAAHLAAQLEIPFVMGRAAPRGKGPDGNEAAGRRERYRFLEGVRRDLGARWIATAHHQDDQAETVLLRLLFGSGLEGLAGILPVHGFVVRPLLNLPRAALADFLQGTGLTPVEDPTNHELGVPRNRVRHRLLPALEPGLAPHLARVAARARGAREALDRRLASRLTPRDLPEGVAVPRAELEALPEALFPFALAHLHRRAGAPYPAAGAARAELLRQLGKGGHGACDCGDGWRWEAAEGWLSLQRAGARRERVPDFTYTLEVPGEIFLPEIAMRFRVGRRALAPWMFRGAPDRAGLALPLEEGDRVTIRNRRPGDRIHPLGASGSRRLKEVLIDRRMPRQERDRLPLLCVGDRGDQIAWVPGVTIDERFRLKDHATAWVAEVATR